MQDNKSIRWKIVCSHDIYKYVADLHERTQDFLVGNKKMIRICPEMLPSEIVEIFLAPCNKSL